MACRLVDTKLLAEAMLEYCLLEREILSENHTFSFEEIKMSSVKWRQFPSASMC